MASINVCIERPGAERFRDRPETILARGGRPLRGELRVQGAKNSTLPLLAAAVACRGETVLHNCPELSDVGVSVRILRRLGCRCVRRGKTLAVCADGMSRRDIPHSLMREMRSSIVFLGAILARAGEASLSFPGGCELGPRPIDLHLLALEKLGVEIREEHGCLLCRAPKGIQGGFISLAFPSVGATENLLLAAATGHGTTVIANAAREPEIVDLAQYLNQCGARIYGAGESCVIVEGVSALSGSEYTVMPDRIVAATYMAAAAVTGGTVLLKKVNGSHLLPVLSAFEEAGCRVMQSGDELLIRAPERLKPVRHVRTMPYPGFPTDAQPLMLAACLKARGTSVQRSRWRARSPSSRVCPRFPARRSRRRICAAGRRSSRRALRRRAKRRSCTPNTSTAATSALRRTCGASARKSTEYERRAQLMRRPKNGSGVQHGPKKGGNRKNGKTIQ